MRNHAGVMLFKIAEMISGLSQIQRRKEIALMVGRESVTWVSIIVAQTDVRDTLAIKGSLYQVFR